jgi:hypothetical protein
MREDVQDYMKILRKNQYTCQMFDYDLAAHQQKD